MVEAAALTLMLDSSDPNFMVDVEGLVYPSPTLPVNVPRLVFYTEQVRQLYQEINHSTTKDEEAPQVWAASL